MSKIDRFIVVIFFLVLSWIFVLLLPILSSIIGVGADMGAWQSPLIPSYFDDGIIWSYKMFVIGLPAVFVMWAIIKAFIRVAFGESRRR
jgi:uncharacterized protein HemY